MANPDVLEYTLNHTFHIDSSLQVNCRLDVTVVCVLELERCVDDAKARCGLTMCERLATTTIRSQGVVVKTTTTRGQSVDVVNWRGIPYTAAPPVGALRFKQMTVAVDRYPVRIHRCIHTRDHLISRSSVLVGSHSALTM